MSHARPWWGWGLLLAMAAGISACSRNPVTGKREVNLMSEKQAEQIGARFASLGPLAERLGLPRHD